MGKFLFYLLWPLVWFYAPLFRRVRVVILCNGSFVAVKNSFGPMVWQLPGGGIDIGESVLDAAKREAQEELGINLKDAVELHENFIVVKQFGLLMRYHYVLAKIGKKSELKITKELEDARWLAGNTKEKVSVEVRQGLELADKQG